MRDGESPAPFAPEEHRRRRERVLEALGPDVMVLPAAPLLVRGRDSELPYRPDPELFYLTGFGEPEAVVVLRGFADEERFVLFCRDRDPDAERWTGPRGGPEAARERTGADASYPIGRLEDVLPGLLDGARHVHFRLHSDPRCRELVIRSLSHARAKGARRGTGPRGVIDPGGILDELRVRKEPAELERIRRAAEITVEAFRDALGRVAPGRGEWEVEAALEAGFRTRGASGAAFPTIVGSGANGCILHYVANRSRIGAGKLVLVDGGAEWDLYTADVTRTVPADGRFTTEQRAVFEVVEAARRSAIDAVAPGVPVEEVHGAAIRELARGLGELGILEGEVDEIVEEKTYRRYFPHNTSHWLGMDVHDPGDYAVPGPEGGGRREPGGKALSRELEPGMVLTVEPGFYLPDPAVRADVREEPLPRAALPFVGMGIRLEDDVLVTPEGREVLTAGLPVSADGVAGLVGRA